MRKCLVIGGTGLIGTHLLKILENDFETTLFCLPHEKPSAKNVKVIHGNLTDPNWTQALPPEMDLIIHLAQSENFRDFPEKALDVFKINTASVAQALDYAVRAKVKSFLFASSGGVYGFGDQPFTPSQKLEVNPNLGYYIGNKLSAELLVQSYSSIFNVVTFRFFFVYGPEQRGDMLIPRLVENVKNGNPITLQGENGITINPIHASDAARLIKQSIELESSQILNIAGKEVLTLRQICDIIGKQVNRDPVYSVDVSVKPRSLIGGIEETKQILGIEPLISFEEGVSELILQKSSCGAATAPSQG